MPSLSPNCDDLSAADLLDHLTSAIVPSQVSLVIPLISVLSVDRSGPTLTLTFLSSSSTPAVGGTSAATVPPPPRLNWSPEENSAYHPLTSAPVPALERNARPPSADAWYISAEKTASSAAAVTGVSLPGIDDRMTPATAASEDRRVRGISRWVSVMSLEAIGVDGARRLQHLLEGQLEALQRERDASPCSMFGF